MSTVIYNGPPGSGHRQNPDLEMLRAGIVDQPEKFWSSGTGDAAIDFKDDGLFTRMFIFVNGANDIYIWFQDGDGSDHLSLYDRDKLGEVIYSDGDHQASVGLFLPREKAWKAIEEFCKTGRRSSEIEWITPDDIPEGGNY